MHPDEKTAALLKQKGLNCICQLCDCGRPHRHSGCTKSFPTMKSTFQMPKMNTETDYQSSFNQKEVLSPIKSMQSAPNSFNPCPLPMDFRTTNRLEFKGRLPGERVKPYKLENQFESLTGPFHGNSVYKVDFPGHKPIPVRTERPVTQKAQTEVKFDKSTMYNDTFQSKKQTRQPTLKELPSFAYSIIYPDKANPVDKVSFKNAVHSGQFTKRPNLMAPKGSTVKIGMEGDHELVTTNDSTFTKPVNIERPQPIKKDTEWKPRQKFSSKTQSQVDFKGFGSKMPLPRKAITPPPETIDLSVNNQRYLETTNKEEHKITWEMNKLHRPPQKKSEEKYISPKEPFQALSVMREDFKEHRNVKPVAIMPPEQAQQNNAEFSGITSYKSQFPEYSDVKVTRHGDNYDRQYYVKPFHKFGQEGSTMREDFKNYEHFERVLPLKPEKKLHTKGEEFYSETSYRKDYTSKSIEPCTFIKILAQTNTK